MKIRNPPCNQEAADLKIKSVNSQVKELCSENQHPREFINRVKFEVIQNPMTELNKPAHSRCFSDLPVVAVGLTYWEIYSLY